MKGKITVNDQVIDWRDGMTVSDVLTVMNYTFKLLVIQIDGKNVKRDDWPTATVPEGADVKVIHLMSGG
ncbi:MAG TPA: sulfur carrier protein ThiS [bacterium]|nr:sulfur carrier protein ThiS [bacterium]